MCGRFTLTVNPADLQETFQNYTFPQNFAPRYNIAPTQPVLVIPNDESNAADFYLWGLIPMEDAARKLHTNRNALYKLLHDARLRLKRRLSMEDISPNEVLTLFEQK